MTTSMLLQGTGVGLESCDGCTLVYQYHGSIHFSIFCGLHVYNFKDALHQKHVVNPDHKSQALQSEG